MDIFVFKTNIRYKKNINTIKPHLTGIESIQSWNVDLEDCDKILRIKGLNIHPASIENLLGNLGYYCEELKD